MVWGKAGSKTLTSAGELTDITLSANKCNSFMNHNVTMSANNDVIIQFNNDTANNYADRLERNGTENTSGSKGNIRLVPSGGAFDSFIVGYYANVESEEKLMILSSMQSNTGAGNAPDRDAGVGKWTNTSAQITEADITTTSTATLGADSNFTALGSEITPVAAITFPTNVQVGSRAEITDSRKMYNYVVPSITRSDDFSSDGWTDSDSTNMGVSGGTFNWNCKRDGSNDASTYDLTSTSANWVLRFKLKVTNVSASTQAGNGFFVGLSDKPNTDGHTTSQDFIGVGIYNDNTDSYRAIDADGSGLPYIYQGDSNQTTTYNTNSVWYYEIIKTGSSYTIEAFSGSDYSTGSEGKITGSSDASGLRYLKILNDMQTIATSTDPFQGTIDDLKFYNGVTQTTNYWQEIGA